MNKLRQWWKDSPGSMLFLAYIAISAPPVAWVAHTLISRAKSLEELLNGLFVVLVWMIITAAVMQLCVFWELNR